MSQPIDPVRTLVFRLTAVTMAVLMILSVMASWAALNRFERVYLPELRHKAEAVGDVLVRQIDRAINYDIPLDALPDLEAAIAAEIKGHGDIAYAAVVADDGRVLARVGAVLAGVSADATPLVAGYDDIVLLLGRDDGTPVGRLHLGVDPGYLASQSVDLMLEVVAEMLVSVLITFEILLLVVHLSMAPVNRLRHAVHLAEGGDFRAEVPPMGGAVGAVAASCRVMLQQLNRRFVALADRVAAAEKTENPVWQAVLRRFHFRPAGAAAAPRPVNLVYLRLPVFLFCLSEELSRPFMPAFAQSFAATAPWLSPDWVVSLPITLFMLVWAISQPSGAKVSERMGRRRAFIVGVLMAVTGLLLTAQTQTLLELLVWRSLTALGYGLVLIAAQGVVIDNTTPRDRASGLAMFVGGLLAAGVCGPATGGIIADQVGARATFVIGAASALLAGLVLIALFGWERGKSGAVAHKPVAAAGKPGGAWGLMTSGRFVALMGLSAIPTKIAATGILFCLVPLLMAQSGASKAEVGRVQMMYYLAFILVAPMAASLADRRRSWRGMLAWGGIGTLASAAPLIVAGTMSGGLHGNPWAAPLAIAVFGAAQALVATPQLTLATRIASTTGVAETVAIGWYRLMERLGGAAGPLIAILLSATYSYGDAILGIGILCGVGGVGIWLLLRGLNAGEETP